MYTRPVPRLVCPAPSVLSPHQAEAICRNMPEEMLPARRGSTRTSATTALTWSSSALGVGGVDVVASARAAE
jgi:hypothetical protein